MSHCTMVVFLAVVSLLPPAAAHPQQVVYPRQPVPMTAFVNVSVIPMDRDRVLADQTVLVRGDRIVALGPAKRVAVPPRAQTVDGRGKYLIPGLADMHAHIYANDRIGGPDPVTGEKYYLDTATIAGVLFAYVANGVTTIRDMHSGGKNSALFALRRRIASGEMLGPRLYMAGDPDHSSAAAIVNSVAELKAAGHDFIKTEGEWAKPIYDSLMAAAHRVGIRVVGHAPAPSVAGLGLEDALHDRMASLEHLTRYLNYVLGRRSNAEEPMLTDSADAAAWNRPDYRLDRGRLDRIVAATKRAGTWNCPTLHKIAIVGTRSPVSRRAFELDLPIVKALHDAGAGLLLGTDAWSIVEDGFAVHDELALLVQAGLTPYQALSTGTRDVAEFLGTADSTGTITVGKRADLVLLKANPLQDIHATTALAGVMVRGQWLPRPKLNELRNISEQAAAAVDSVWR